MDLILEQTKKALPLTITRPMPVSSSRHPPTARLHKKVAMIDEQLRTPVESQPQWLEPRYVMMGMDDGGFVGQEAFFYQVLWRGDHVLPRISRTETHQSWLTFL